MLRSALKPCLRQSPTVPAVCGLSSSLCKPALARSHPAGGSRSGAGRTQLRVAYPAALSSVRAASSFTQQCHTEQTKPDSSWPALMRNVLAQAAKIVALASLAMAVMLGVGADPAYAGRSGGRVGGSAFGGSAQSSSSFGGGSHSLGGSFGGGGGSSWAGHRGGSSLSSNSGYRPANAGFGGGVSIMPSFIVPIGGGGYHTGGASLGTILFVGMAAFMLIQLLSSMRRQGSSYDEDETVLSLLRNPQYCVYGASTSQQVAGEAAGEQAYQAMSLAERGKFSQETLSNYGGVSRSSALRTGPGGMDEMLVVTVVVAAAGRLAIPKISTPADLQAALAALGGIAPSKVLAVELLWSPQAPGDSLTRDEVMMDYPALAAL